MQYLVSILPMLFNLQGDMNNIASYFFETGLIHKFITCFEDEVQQNPSFQEKLMEISNLEYGNYQGSEFLIKKSIETNTEFDEMKIKLFRRFNSILKDVLKSPEEDTTHQLMQL